MTKVWKHWNRCRKWSGPSLNKLVFLLNPLSWETWASSSCLDGEALDLWESISWAKWRVKRPNWQRAVELFRTPHCPSRWSWARWFTGRGGGPGQVLAAAGERWEGEFAGPSPALPWMCLAEEGRCPALTDVQTGKVSRYRVGKVGN